MILMFSPVLMDAPYEARVDGDVLIIDGVALDFGPLPAGAILPRAAIDSPWIAGDVARDAGGVLTVPLILPHGARAPHATRFPAPIEAGDGPVDLPLFETPVPEDSHED